MISIIFRPVGLFLALAWLAAVWIGGQTFAADEGAYAAGDAVEIQWGGTWYPGKVKSAKDGKFEVTYTGWDSASDEWVTADRLRTKSGAARTRPARPSKQEEAEDFGEATTKFSPGDVVDAKKGKNWYPATVLKLEGEKTYVHYNGKDKKFDEWLTADRIRAAAEAAEDKPSAPTRGTPAKSAEKDAPAAAGATIVEADWSLVSPVEMSDLPDTYSLAADPATAVKVRNRPIELRDDPAWASGKADHYRQTSGRPFFSHVKKIAVARSTGSESIVVQNWEPPGQEAQARLARCDLAAGKLTASIVLPEGTVPLDISPDGKRVVGLSHVRDHNEHQARVDLFSLAGKKWQHIVSWVPYEEEKWPKRNLQWVMFVDNEHIATCNHDHQVVVWNANSARAVYKLPARGAQAVLSPGGKYLAVRTSDGLVFLDPPTGRPLASIDVPQRHHTAALAFDESGQRVASAGDGHVMIWSLSDGKLLQEVWLSTPSDWSLTFVGEEYLLVGGTQLVGVEQGCVIWTYESLPHQLGNTVGGHLWYVSDDKNRLALAPASLPHREALAALGQFNAATHFALRAGAQVTLDLSAASAEETERQATTDALVKQLAAADVRVADGQPLKLVLTVQPGESKEVSYRMFGAGVATRNVQTYVSKIEFTLDGQPLWTRQTQTHPPHMLHLKADQSLDQALADYTKPNLKFFQSITLPWRLPLPQYKDGFGKSSL